MVLVIAEQQSLGLIEAFPELMVKLGGIPLTTRLNLPYQTENVPINMYVFTYKMYVVGLPRNYRICC